MTRVVVLGAGVSGAAAAGLAARLGHRVTVYDERTPLGVAGVADAVGDWDPGLLDGVDVVVTSPGFPERSRPVVDTLEAGIELISEVEFAWRHLPLRPTVAVTGTNGKTTVTGLVADMLGRSGRLAPAFGNIGTALSTAVEEPPDVVVVEVSSFQLRFIDTFHPTVAVITNLAPDHLDWHGSFANYEAAKARILERQQPDDLTVFDADDPGATRLAARSPARRHPVSGRSRPEQGSGVEDGALVSGRARIGLDRLGVDDPAFLADLVAAAAAALDVGADPDDVAAVWEGFRPAPHRRTTVAVIGGVTFVDDSKATNPHAALAAIRSFDSVVLIAGGLAKGLDLAPLVTEPRVRRVVAIGEAAAALEAVDPRRVVAAASMGEAVQRAMEAARPGDTVLLAPGCASFDMFDSYAARGEAFAAAVRSIERGEVAS